MSARPVVVTRPQPQTEILAQKVAGIGRVAITFPLLEIGPLPNDAELLAALEALSSYKLVAFVGPNAIEAAFTRLPKWPAGVAIAIMGEGSRQALAAHGITDANAHIFMPADTGRSDSETLLQALDLQSLKGQRALIIRGDTGRELLADALRAAECQVTQVAAYRRFAPAMLPQVRERLDHLIRTQNDWIVTSSEALRNLVQMAKNLGGDDAVAKLQRQHFLVSHARIAENARNLGFVNVIHVGSGDERMLAALQFDYERITESHPNT